MTAEPSINKDIRNRNKMRGTLYTNQKLKRETGAYCQNSYYTQYAKHANTKLFTDEFGQFTSLVS